MPRAIASSTFCLDLGQLWDKRVEILGKTNAAGFDDGEKNIIRTYPFVSEIDANGGTALATVNTIMSIQDSDA